MSEAPPCSRALSSLWRRWWVRLKSHFHRPSSQESPGGNLVGQLWHTRIFGFLRRFCSQVSHILKKKKKKQDHFWNVGRCRNTLQIHKAMNFNISHSKSPHQLKDTYICRAMVFKTLILLRLAYSAGTSFSLTLFIVSSSFEMLQSQL